MKVVKYIRKVFLYLQFKADPIRCSRKMGVMIGEGSKIYGGKPGMWGTEPFLINIGSNVHITDGCRFITHDGGTLALRHLDPTLEITAPITVGNNVYFGVDSVVLPGVKIGDNVVIGARSLIARDLPSNAVYAGSPAKHIKSIHDYHKKIKANSLGIGHLNKKDKELKIKEIFSSFRNLTS